jgi:hypothetical protein
MSAAPAIAASVAVVVPARGKAAAKGAARLPVSATAGRHTRSVPVQDPAVSAIGEPPPTSQAQVDTSTGGASAPGEEDGFGYGVDGLTPRSAPKTTTSTPDSASVPSSAGGSGDGPAPSANASQNGGESGTTATGASAGSASGSMLPG